MRKVPKVSPIIHRSSSLRWKARPEFRAGLFSFLTAIYATFQWHTSVSLARPINKTDSTKRVDEASPSATLRFQCLGMMAKMVIDKGADEVIAVIVARLNTQRQRMIRRVCS